MCNAVNCESHKVTYFSPVHNKIVTYLTFSKRCHRLWPLYCKLKVLPLSILIQIEHAKTMYKFQEKMLPQVFNSYFEKPCHNHATRFATRNNLAVLRISTALDRSRLRYIGPQVWLNIPPNIKEASSLKVFINMYRNHLLGHFDENLVTH